MGTEEFPYSKTFNAGKVVDKDLSVDVRPDEAELEKIALSYELEKLIALTGRFTLKPFRKEGLRVKGPIDADIIQKCVVTLEPFETKVRIDVDRTFEAHWSKSRKANDVNADGEIEIDLESIDPPDVLLDGVVDLGAIICEELALSLDPFPKKPGVEFSSGQQDEEEFEERQGTRPNAFAALQVLKDKSSK